jgi:hypothetical protein
MLLCVLLCCCADPRLTDYDLLLQNLADLRAGKAAQVSNGKSISSCGTSQQQQQQQHI